MFNKIILNIPHSSTEYPKIEGYFNWKGNIEEKIEKWTDKYTDKLFHSNLPNCQEIVFPYTRFFCDAERLSENEPMEKIGQGIYYIKYDDCERITNEEEKEFVLKLHAIHQQKLSDAIFDSNNLLIDCHSFPRDFSDIDICIGWNEDWSKPDDETIDIITDHFKGYKIGFNEPYSNSITPKKDFEYKSIMIEINKKCYLDKDDKINSFFYKKNYFINYLYKKLLSSEKN